MKYDPVRAARGIFTLYDRPESLIMLKDVGYVSRAFCIIGGAIYHPNYAFDVNDICSALDAFWQNSVYLASNGDRFVIPFVSLIDRKNAIVQGQSVVIPSDHDVTYLKGAVIGHWRNA